MSTTGTPTPPAATVNPDAVRFVNDMVTNTQLLQAYATVVDQVAQSADKDPAPINTFLTSHGYNATAQDIVIALLAIQGQQVAYWSDTYTMQFVGQNGALTPGPLLTVNPPTPSGTARIGYGPSWLIEPVFADWQLTWVQKDNQGNALNQTGGSLTFSISQADSGATVRACNGNITGADGTAQQVVGAQQGATPPPGSTPSGQDTTTLAWIAGVTGAVVCVATVVTGIFTWRSTWRNAELERTKLQLEVNKLQQEANQQGGAGGHPPDAGADHQPDAAGVQAADEAVSQAEAELSRSSGVARSQVEMVSRSSAPSEASGDNVLEISSDERADLESELSHAPPSAEQEQLIGEAINKNDENENLDQGNLEDRTEDLPGAANQDKSEEEESF